MFLHRSGEINMTQSANQDAQIISTVISSQIEDDYIIDEAKYYLTT